MLVMEECKNKIMDSIRGLEPDITSDFLHLIQIGIAGLPLFGRIARFLIETIWCDRTGWRGDIAGFGPAKRNISDFYPEEGHLWSNFSLPLQRYAWTVPTW